MIKLKDILTEVGEGTATPYKFKFKKSTFGGKERSYAFTTDSSLEYEASLTSLMSTKNFTSLKTNLYVSFKTVTGDYSDVTNKGEQFKIMATVIAIIKADIEFLAKEGNPPVKVIKFAPEKSDDNDNRRANFYKAYIQKQLPNARVDYKGGVYQVTL